jgi:non-homologous end joining protein Ku
MARSLVASLETGFRPEKHEDTYRASVEKLIRQKAKGQEIDVPARHDNELAPDLLMAALEASVKGGR